MRNRKGHTVFISTSTGGKKQDKQQSGDDREMTKSPQMEICSIYTQLTVHDIIIIITILIYTYQQQNYEDEGKGCHGSTECINKTFECRFGLCVRL